MINKPNSFLIVGMIIILISMVGISLFSNTQLKKQSEQIIEIKEELLFTQHRLNESLERMNDINGKKSALEQKYIETK